ncbi:DUF1361 domain-containing protein [Lacinutrix undariae]
MNTFINRIFHRKKESTLLITSVICCIALLTFRMKYTNSPYFLFLVWNLFLAGIPFIISTYIISSKTVSKFRLVFYTTVWLLFLPNAPYIMTDLYHLRASHHQMIWLDLLVLFSFAVSGLVLFYLSIIDMYHQFLAVFNKKTANYVMYLSCFLSGFGIYLGRFLRYNSWELISNPSQLFKDCLAILSHPKLHADAWVFTLCTGVFLSIGLYTFIHINHSKKA